MSCRIYIEGYEADTFGDIDVDFTYSVSDIEDIERRSTSYSKTIVLPSTERNQKLFGNIFDISVQNEYYDGELNVLSNFNPAKQGKAQIFLDNVKVFDGIIRLIKISNVRGDITYETNVFGRLKDILHEIGDKTLAELNFDDYNHIWNVTNISASWSRTGWVNAAQNYVYPLVDYGYTTDGINYPLTSFRPAVFIREILKRIFADCGFEIVSPFFDTSYFKSMIMVTAEKSITRQVSTLLDQRLATNVDIVTTPSMYSDRLNFTDYLHDGFIISDLGAKFTWNLSTPLSTALTFNVVVTLRSVAVNDNFWHVIVRKNGSDLVAANVHVISTYVNQTYVWTVSIPTTLTLNLGDYLEVYIEGDVQFGYTQMQSRVNISNAILKVGNTVPVAVNLQEGDTMKVSYIMPKSIKQRDFLKSIITMHNLYITQDKLQDNVLEITPYVDFYREQKDTAVDWTDKLDVSQNVSITPLSELNYKEYRIAFDDDADYWSTSYKTKFNQGYGESRTIIDNDFELDIKQLKVVVAPPVVREEITGRQMIHLYKVENGIKIPDNFKPRIAFWKPNVTCPTSWNITRIGGTSTYTSYPYAGHINDPLLPTSDLLFGYPKEVYFNISLYPTENLYVKYYDKLISAIGDKYSRLIVGYFYLNPIDVMNLDFRNLVKVKNHFYQLQKVDKYNPIANTLCQVSLLKVLSGLQPADFDYILLETDDFMLQENDISKFYI